MGRSSRSELLQRADRLLARAMAGIERSHERIARNQARMAESENPRRAMPTAIPEPIFD
jgi:hypothetical protein